MLHALEDGNLIDQSLPCVVVDNLLLLEDLDGDRLARVPLDGRPHLAKGALADDLEQRVCDSKRERTVVLFAVSFLPGSRKRQAAEKKDETRKRVVRTVSDGVETASLLWWCHLRHGEDE